MLLAACGSSGSSAKSASTPTTAKAASSTTAAGSTSTAIVKTASNPQLGTILVDADGKTLYTLSNQGVAVACTGGCLTAWPPLLLPAGTTTATGAAGVTDLATTPEGTSTQVTQAGLPLYRFAGDAAAGDTKGDGVPAMGGTWHVVKISGTTTGSSTGSSTTSTSKSKYSY